MIPVIDQLAGILSWLQEPCNAVGIGLAIVGVLIIIVAIIGMALSRRAGALYFIGILLGLGLILGSVFFGGYLVQACKDATGTKVGFKDFYIDVIYEDNSTERIPASPTQMLVYLNPSKRIRALKWYAEIDRTKIAEWAAKLGLTTKEVKKVKFWMFWNKPLTTGVSLWEKYIDVENYTAVYEMPYSELEDIVQQHAGAELLPSIMGQNFSMDINIGVDVVEPKELSGQAKYDHALKLWVDYKANSDIAIVITAFDVDYVTNIVVPQFFGGNGEGKAYLTQYGLWVIVGLILGAFAMYYYMRHEEERRRRR